MPNTITTKKFLDAAGLTYFSRKLNDYPNNNVLEAVIEGIQDALDEKVDSDKVGAANGVASLNSSGLVPLAELPIELGTTAELNSDITYIPARGQIIIYTDRGTITKNNQSQNVPGVKIGDGSAYLVDLPFVGDDQIQSVITTIQGHINEAEIHVSSSDREKWNNKLNYTLSGETLILNRL